MSDGNQSTRRISVGRYSVRRGEQARVSWPLVTAIWANAGIMSAVLVILLVGRGDGPTQGTPAEGGWPADDGGTPRLPSLSLLPSAMAQQTPVPIAGGAGLFLMPAQFSQNVWGCYVMDVDAQTLMAYRFDTASTELRLIAARDFRHDRRLRRFNTTPPPDDVRRIIDAETRTGTTGDPAVPTQGFTNPGTPRPGHDAAPPPSTSEGSLELGR